MNDFKRELGTVNYMWIYPHIFCSTTRLCTNSMTRISSSQQLLLDLFLQISQNLSNIFYKIVKTLVKHGYLLMNPTNV